MLELCLLFYFLFVKLQNYWIFLQPPKRIFTQMKYLFYTPDLIQIKDVQASVEVAQKQCFEAA